jgi:enamine deaminase RidA (YjgF/YER057c/UK114 family)
MSVRGNEVPMAQRGSKPTVTNENAHARKLQDILLHPTSMQEFLEISVTEKAFVPERRLKELGISLPQPPKPLGAYVESLQTGSLLFLSGTLPVEAGKPKYVGRIGDDLSLEDGRHAARLAALNALAVAKEHLVSLNRVTQVVRLGISLVTTYDFREHPKVADAASDLFLSIFGPEKISTRLVLGMGTLPLGMCVELEVILEVV